MSLVGKTLYGYLIRRQIGEGGMGAVYEGYRADLDKRVAIKVLSRELAKDRQHAARFVNEAIGTSRVKQPGFESMHENVVGVEHVGTDDEGQPFIVYEFLEGSDLDARVRSFGPSAVDFAGSVILQVCRVLDAAHPAIVHRDLKPANVFITRKPGRDPFVKLLDFGIAKLRRDMTTTGVATGVGGIMGTPLFMAPEQAETPLAIDHRADIFALGGVIYYVLTGRYAYPEHLAYLDILAMQREGRLPVPVTQLRPDLDPRWDLIVANCLAYDRSRRYQNVRLLAMDVVAATPGGAAIFEKVWPDYQAGPDDVTVRNSSGALPVTRTVPPPSALTSHAAAVGSRTSTRPPGRRRWAFAAVAGAAVAAGVAVTLALTLGGGAAATADESTETPHAGAASKTPAAPIEPIEGVSIDAGAPPTPTPVEPEPVDTSRQSGPVASPEGPDPGESSRSDRRRKARASAPAAQGSAQVGADPQPASGPAQPPVDAGVQVKRKSSNKDDLLLGR